MDVRESLDTTKEEGELSDDEDIFPVSVQCQESFQASDRKLTPATFKTVPNTRNSEVYRNASRSRFCRSRSRWKARARYKASSASKHDHNCLNSSTDVTPLLSLPLNILCEPPPPPPQSPPPLPGEPPPDRPEPPPLHLPPEIPKQRKRKTTLATAGKSVSSAFNKSPPAGDIEDPDYIDLLLEYQQVRKRLSQLASAESAQHSEKTEDGFSVTTPEQVAVSPQNSDEQQNNNEVTEKEETNKTNNSTENDELDVLKLRLDALKSVPTELGKKTVDNQKDKKEGHVRRLPFAPSSLRSVGSQQHSARYRSLGSHYLRMPPLRHDTVRRREQWRARRQPEEQRNNERERRNGKWCMYDKKKRREQYMNRRSIEVKKILTLDDPKEQYKKFMELVAGVKNVEEPVNDGQARDNYDPVEMELDSDGEQPAGSHVIKQPQPCWIPDVDSAPLAPPFNYEPTVVPEGLAVPGYFSDVDYRPIIDRSLPRENFATLPYSLYPRADVLDQDLSATLFQPLKQYNTDVLLYDNTLPDAGPSVMPSVSDLTRIAEKQAADHTCYGTAGDATALITEYFSGFEVQSKTLDATTSNITPSSLTPEGEDEETILRAKLLQSLMAKKKLPAVSSASSGHSSPGGVSPSRQQSKPLVSDGQSNHLPQGETDQNGSAPKHTSEHDLEDEQEVERSNLLESHSGTRPNKTAQRTPTLDTCLNQAQLAISELDRPLGSGYSSPDLGLASCSYDVLSQPIEAEGSAAGSPCSGQDGMERVVDPDVNDAVRKSIPQYKQARHYYMKNYYKVPQHKPVVIRLGEDSESEEDNQGKATNQPPAAEEITAHNTPEKNNVNELEVSTLLLPGNLDVFLKEARMSVESKEKTTPSKGIKKSCEEEKSRAERSTTKDAQQDVSENVNSNEDKVLMIETELIQHRHLLSVKQAGLNKIKREIMRKNSVLSMAEEHVQRLHEQLIAAEKIVKTNKLQLCRLNKQAQDNQALVDEKKARIQALEAQLDSFSKKTSNHLHKIKPRSPMDKSLKVTISKRAEVTRQVTLPCKTNSALKTVSGRRTVTMNNKATTVKSNVRKTQKLVVSSPGKQQDQRAKKGEEKLVGGTQEDGDHLKADVNRSVNRSEPEVLNSVLKEQPQAKAAKISDTAREKARLMMLEKKYAEMIRRHKEAQERKNSALIPAKKFKSSAQATENHMPAPGQSTKLSEKEGSPVPIRQEVKVKTDGKSEIRRTGIVKNKRTFEVKCAGENVRAKSVISGSNHAQMERQVKNKVINDVVTEHCRYLSQTSNTGRSGQSYPAVFSDARSTQNHTPSVAYQSSLLQFHSYRLSPYFRLKSHCNLTSLTYSHKVNADVVLCQYDLMGKCSDEKCQYQHKTDYEMSTEELLKEIASYCPSLYSHHHDTPLDSDLDNFIAEFQKTNVKFNAEEQSLLLVSIVNEALKKAGQNHVITLTRQYWPSGGNHAHTDSIHQEKTLGMSSSGRQGLILPSDMTWSEPEVRYWSNNTLHDLESIVQSDNKNADSWIDLAYYKLNHSKKRETGLNDALSVLAKGLESNRTSATLWLHYLDLYEQRPDASTIDRLYKQAVKFSPCFDIYWKYIQRTKSFTDCLDLCQKALEYLTSCDLKDASKESSSKHSHHILQIIIYKVSLYISMVKCTEAADLVKDVLVATKEFSFKLGSCLSPEDKVLLYLLHGYITITKTFPYEMYSFNGIPKDWLVNKEYLLTSISWFDILSDKNTDIEHSKARMALTCANQATEFITGLQENCRPDNFNMIVCHLCRSVVEINIMMFSDVSKVVTELRDTVFCSQSNITQCYSVIVEELMKAHQQNRLVLTTRDVTKLSEEALKLPVRPSRLWLALADCRFFLGDTDVALELIEDCVMSVFDCDTKNPSECDPNNLYCNLLGQPLPLSYKGPSFKSHLAKQWLQTELPYLWQCYCFLLELQGYQEETVQAYEAAILYVRDSASLAQIWLRYLRQQGRLLQVTTGAQRAEIHSQMTSLTLRCLNSLPARVDVPYCSGQTWLNYQAHNDVIALYLESCPAEDMLDIYERLIKILPHNIHLLIRAVDYMESEGHHSLAIGYCITALDDLRYCAQLWITYINLLRKKAKKDQFSREQLQNTYRQATGYLPKETVLWKDWAMFVSSLNNSELLQYIRNHCTLPEGELGGLLGRERCVEHPRAEHEK